MRTLRRRLASCALVLVVLQTALVFAAPLSACCPARTAHAAAHEDQEKECCPAGAHPPGECPRQSRPGAPSAVSCRMQCDAPHGLQFLSGVVGLIAPPASATIALAARHLTLASAPRAVLMSVVPDLPPPRLR